MIMSTTVLLLIYIRSNFQHVSAINDMTFKESIESIQYNLII